MNIRLEACVLGLLLGSCTVQAEPPPASGPASDPAPDPPTSADAPHGSEDVAPEVVPQDDCLGCGLAFVPEQSKRFLDEYSSTNDGGDENG